jgi:hypothetical protein
MSALREERANIVRSDLRDVSNLYGALAPGREQEPRVRRIPLEKEASALEVAAMTIGTLVAKEESEQEGYKVIGSGSRLQ